MNPTRSHLGADFRSPSDPIEAAAADWVTRVDAGLTREEQQIFQDWLSGDPRHADAFDRLTEAWSVFDRVQDRGAASTILNALAQRASQRRTRRVRAGIAAGLLVAAGLFYFQLRSSPDTLSPSAPSPIANAPVAPDPIRKLPDGSIVELQAGAEILVQYSDSARHVKLVKGEAFFRVEKDKTRPFFVEANGVVVRAVGTAFAVGMQSAAVEVVVREGTVDVARRNGGVTRLEANERAVFQLIRLRPALKQPAATAAPAGPAEPDASVQPESMSEEQMAARLAWRIPWIQFEGTTLAEAVRQLNLHNQLQLRLETSALGEFQISGIYRADNPEGFIRMLELSEVAKVDRLGGDEVVLKPGRGIRP